MKIVVYRFFGDVPNANKYIGRVASLKKPKVNMNNLENDVIVIN
jgi:hypothetical protein